MFTKYPLMKLHIPASDSSLIARTEIESKNKYFSRESVVYLHSTKKLTESFVFSRDVL